MRIPKGLYFLLNILFILAIGYILAPLPSAQSIAREWVVRIEKQVEKTTSSYDKDSQIRSLKKLIKEGSVEFSAEEKVRGYELLFIIQKQFALDMENSRIDRIIGVINKKYLDQMPKEERVAIETQGKLGGSFYILSNQPIYKLEMGKNIHVITLNNKTISFEAYYLVTSRSGKKFLLSVEEGQTLRVGFLLMTHEDSKTKWKKVLKLIPNFSKKKLIVSK